MLGLGERTQGSNRCNKSRQINNISVLHGIIYYAFTAEETLSSAKETFELREQAIFGILRDWMALSQIKFYAGRLERLRV